MTVGILFIDHGGQCGELTGLGKEGENGAIIFWKKLAKQIVNNNLDYNGIQSMLPIQAKQCATEPNFIDPVYLKWPKLSGG